MRSSDNFFRMQVLGLSFVSAICNQVICFRAFESCSPRESPGRDILRSSLE